VSLKILKVKINIIQNKEMDKEKPWLDRASDWFKSFDESG
jgi:hypothetical protein